MQYSTVAQQQKSANLSTRTTGIHGRVRQALLDTTISAADDDVTLLYLPAGRVRILPQSLVSASLATGTTTVKIGYEAYTKYDGTTQSADDDALMSATAASSVSNKNLNPFVFESSSGVILVAKFSANAAANDTLKGSLLYVID